ncbi:DUF937 domain-containing protein [Tahibacter soli]|uniref:DUF937 domain-containing protein n=1 Tax=Tahibacter soli TaxID=2983605 RepID=A0A9X3YHB4_9GAMM|nr:DUF937 domain-containing protein [Tahibacter soli]MDC8011060.1 DUF937 domain-containing protein [Tahibacter soli]
MSGVVDAVMNEIGDQEIGAVAQRFGLSPDEAQNAIAQALPLMVGALARNSATPEGAQALHGALERDHSGVDIGGLLGGLFGGGAQGGGGIGDVLGSVLGGGRAGGAQGGGIGDVLGGVLGGGQTGGAQGGGIGDVLGSVLGGGQAGGTQGGGIGGAILGHIFGSRQKQAADGLGQTTGMSAGNAMQLLAMLAPIVMAVLGRMNRNQQLGPGGLGEALGRDNERARAGGGVTGGLLGAVLDRDGDGDVDLSDLMQVGGGLIGSMARR